MSRSANIVDSWSASEYNKTASFVYSTENTAPVLTLLDPRFGDKIIDFGCGSGQVTLELSKVVSDAGFVVGVDSSQSMAGIIVLSIHGLLVSHRRFQIDKAKENGLKEAYVQDIQALDDGFASELLAKRGRFDKVFSSAVLHWCKRDPVGVIRSARKVLKPGGLFAAEFGGWGNCIGRREPSVSPRSHLTIPRRSLCSALGLA